MTTYRCTLPSRYAPGTPGFNNASARQGHYVVAATEGEAVKLVRERLQKSGDWRMGDTIQVDVASNTIQSPLNRSEIAERYGLDEHDGVHGSRRR